MSISNVNSILAAYMNSLSAVGSTGSYGRIGNSYQKSNSFYTMLQSQQANRMKQEIYKKFQVSVGDYSGNFKCYIPSEVLCKMNTDKELKEKVFNSLEKCSKEEFKNSMKCTVIFDEEGEMTATLETDNGKQKKSSVSTNLMYQKLLMQQTALMPYQINMYSGYHNLYGLNGINSYNYSLLRNFLKN